jgi:hypothetical protein
LIQFGFFATGDDSKLQEVEEAFPPEDDGPQDEVVELEYEYIDDDV